jgi:hypothetical protein
MAIHLSDVLGVTAISTSRLRFLVKLVIMYVIINTKSLLTILCFAEVRHTRLTALSRRVSDLADVVFMKHTVPQSIALSGLSDEEAEKSAKALNEGMQAKAKALGFWYKVVKDVDYQ